MMMRGIGFVVRTAVWENHLRRRGYDEADIESIILNRVLFTTFAALAIVTALVMVLTWSFRLVPVIFGVLTVIFTVCAVCFWLNYREYKLDK